MTLEEMEQVARAVVSALCAHPRMAAEYHQEDATPGESLPILFVYRGDNFVLYLDVV